MRKLARHYINLPDEEEMTKAQVSVYVRCGLPVPTSQLRTRTTSDLLLVDCGTCLRSLAQEAKIEQVLRPYRAAAALREEVK